MSIALIQHAQNDGGPGAVASLAQAFASNVAANDLLICIVRLGGTPTSCTITDTQSNSWTNLTFHAVTGVGALQISWAIAGSSGACTVTATPKASVSIRMAIAEYSGVATSSPVDVENNSATSTSTAPAANSITPSQDNELIIAAAAVSNGEIFTAGTNFTLEEQVPTGTSGKLGFQDWIQTTATSTTGPFSLNSSDQWESAIAAFKPSGGASIPTVLDDGDAQSQRFSQTSRMESQHQQELAETFGILPTRPPFAYEDDGANMRWSDWRALHYEDPETQRALPPTPPFAIQDEHQDEKNFNWSAIQYEDTETQRALPPTPPVSIQEEFTEELFVDWRARQYEDTDTHRALPPTPPFAIQDEHQDEKNFNWSAIQYEDTETQRALPPTPPFAIQDEVSERGLPGVVPFFEEDQPGKPIVAAAAPNIGLDDIEAHVKAYDRTNVYHEDDLSTFAPTPPVSIQDDEQHTWRGWLSPAIEDDWRALPPVPPFVVPDDTAEKWTASSAPALEDDQATVPPIPPLPPSSIQDDEQHTWRGWLSPAIEDDWSARAPIPPLAFEDDLKTIAPNPVFFSYSDTDFTGRPPVPFSFGDDDQSLQRYMVGGLSALIVLDEFVGAPIVSALGPPTLSSLSAAIRPGIDAQNAAVRSPIDSRGAAARPAIDSQSAIVRPS